jgi:hypothetical protein
MKTRYKLKEKTIITASFIYKKIFKYNIPFKIKFQEAYPTIKLPDKEKIVILV